MARVCLAVIASMLLLLGLVSCSDIRVPEGMKLTKKHFAGRSGGKSVHAGAGKISSGPIFATLDKVVVAVSNYCVGPLTLNPGQTSIDKGEWVVQPPYEVAGDPMGFAAKYSNGINIANGTVTYVNKQQWGTARPLMVFFNAIVDNFDIATLTPEGVQVTVVYDQIGTVGTANVIIGNGTHTSSLC